MLTIKGHFDGNNVVLDEPAALTVGQPLRVIIETAPATSPDDTDEFIATASSSTGFWDNPLDDVDWNAL